MGQRPRRCPVRCHCAAVATDPPTHALPISARRTTTYAAFAAGACATTTTAIPAIGTTL
jgi:hypothetical protein